MLHRVRRDMLFCGLAVAEVGMEAEVLAAALDIVAC